MLYRILRILGKICKDINGFKEKKPYVFYTLVWWKSCTVSRALTQCPNPHKNLSLYYGQAIFIAAYQYTRGICCANSKSEKQKKLAPKVFTQGLRAIFPH